MGKIQLECRIYSNVVGNTLNVVAWRPNYLQKAKKKPIKKVSAKDLGVDTTARIEVLSVEDPPTRQAGVILPDVDQLIVKLKEGGHVQ